MKSKKIKLVIFHPYSSLGGADKSIARLINNLNFNKYEVIFMSLNNAYIKKLLKKKIKIIKLNSSRTILSIFEVRKFLKKYSINEKIIFISNQNFANIISTFIVKNFTNIKLVLIERNHLDEFNYCKNYIDYFKKKILKFLMKKYYKNSDLIIGNSKILSKDLSKYVKKKVVSIYNPAYDKSIIELSKNNINYKKKNNLIITIGRLEIQKDHFTLIKAIKNLKNVNLLIIGYGSLLDELKKFIILNKLNKRVKILTNISNPYPFLKKADLFVLTSLYEGFPNVITEALTLKIPVIASNCNSGPMEILFNNNNQIFKKGNYIELEKKIKSFFKDKNILKSKTNFLYKKLSRFSPNKISKMYEKEFNNLLN